MNYAVIDVETTGLGGSSNKITEIALVLHDGTKKIDEYHTLVNPKTPISPYVVGLTRIDDNMVADAPTFDEIADKVLQLTESCVFVAHNVNFDYNVVRNEFKSVGIDFNRKKLCTVRLSRKIFPGLHSYSLGKLCSYLNIELQNRHRAKGDTDATVVLFEKLIKNDAENLIQKQLKSRNGEAALPALLAKEIYDALPESPGVYYFKNDKGKIIYVGKAINIKKRVLGHFYDKKSREIALCRETAHIEYEESGSELLALLMESGAIKKHYPKYNRAQKASNKGYAVLSYTNRKGILQLGYNKTNLVPVPIAVFYKVTDCVQFLEMLCEQFELCPKYTQLLSTTNRTGKCNHYKLTNCKGVCNDKEAVRAYNERVRQAIESIKITAESFVMITSGRNKDEQSVVLVEDGVYKGYGFIEKSVQITDFEEFGHYIQLQKNNSDCTRIVQQYMLQENKVKIVRPQTL